MDDVYRVNIISDSKREFKRGGYRYVALCNGSTYALELINEPEAICEATVYIDGQDVGTWILNGRYSTIIERPSDVARQFTFFRETSSYARRTGAVVGDEMNGLIKVVFKPAKRERYAPIRATGRESYSDRSYKQSVSGMAESRTAPMSFAPKSTARMSVSGANEQAKRSVSGVTVLGDESDQRFRSARGMRDDEIDWSDITTINIRLVVDDSLCRDEYVPLSSRRRRSRSPPPRIEDACPECGSYYR
jgi:hypothetical protein